MVLHGEIPAALFLFLVVRVEFFYLVVLVFKHFLQVQGIAGCIGTCSLLRAQLGAVGLAQLWTALLFNGLVGVRAICMVSGYLWVFPVALLLTSIMIAKTVPANR